MIKSEWVIGFQSMAQISDCKGNTFFRHNITQKSHLTLYLTITVFAEEKNIAKHFVIQNNMCIFAA